MVSGNQSYMGGGMGSANMSPTSQSTASVYNDMGFYNPGGYLGTGNGMPTWTSNPIWGNGMSSGGMGIGPYGGMGNQAMYNWIGSMFNPKNMLYNQQNTDKATQSKGGNSFNGYPPGIPPGVGVNPNMWGGGSWGTPQMPPGMPHIPPGIPTAPGMPPLPQGGGVANATGDPPQSPPPAAGTVAVPPGYEPGSISAQHSPQYQNAMLPPAVQGMLGGPMPAGLGELVLGRRWHNR